MDSMYDGNALTGALSEVFAADVSIALARCRGCGLSSVVADLAAYGPDPGWVARCPGCEDVVLRIVRTPDSVWVDLGGMSSLRLPARAAEL